MTATDFATRAQRHSALRAELDRQGVLFPAERELLLEAADALLFDEPDAELCRIEALHMLDELEANGRRTAGEAARLRDALTGCGRLDTELVPT